MKPDEGTTTKGIFWPTRLGPGATGEDGTSCSGMAGSGAQTMLSQLCLALSLRCAFSRSYKTYKLLLQASTSATTVKKELSFPTVKAKVPSLCRQESLPMLGWVQEWGVRSAPPEAQGLWQKEQWFIIEKAKCHYYGGRWGRGKAGKPGRGLRCHQQCLRGLFPKLSATVFPIQ